MLDLFYRLIGHTPAVPLNRRGLPFKRHRAEMRIYQVWMAKLIVRLSAVFLAVDMGLGKTIATLAAIKYLLDNGTVSRVLIVGPKRVATDTWPDEICDWDFLDSLEFALCVGTPEERIAALDQRAPVTIINRENLQWLYEYLGEGARWDFDMLVYDEASRLKAFVVRAKTKKEPGEAKAKFKARVTEFGALAMVRDRFKRIVLLSGTPAPNGLVDLGGPAFIADGGQRLGRNKTAFLSRWFIEEKYTNKIIPHSFAFAQITGALKGLMFSLRAEDHIEVPKHVIQDHWVKLSKAHMKQYREFKKTLYSEDYDIEAASAGVMVNKLLQFANGSMYRMPEGVENPVRETIHIHDEKLAPLESILEEAAGQTVLLAYEFEFDLERIKKRYPHVVVFDETPDFVARWNRGEIAFGAAHPASMSHGLNLQHGGHIQVWFGLTWSLELYQQFNKRLARSGQAAEHTIIHRILARETFDERQAMVLEQKDITQDAVNDVFRVELLEIERDAA